MYCPKIRARSKSSFSTHSVLGATQSLNLDLAEKLKSQENETEKVKQVIKNLSEQRKKDLMKLKVLEEEKTQGPAAGSEHIDRIADLQADLAESNAQVAQCAEFGQQLVASLNESKATVDELQHELGMLREENEGLKASIAEAASERRNGSVLQNMFECEKQDMLRANEELRQKLNAANALASRKSEELDRRVSMKAVVPGLNLLSALPSKSPLDETQPQHSPKHVYGDSTDATPRKSADLVALEKKNAELEETVVSLETEVGRLQVLLDEAFDDLDNERRMRNEILSRRQMASSVGESDMHMMMSPRKPNEEFDEDAGGGNEFPELPPESNVSFARRESMDRTHATIDFSSDDRQHFGNERTLTEWCGQENDGSVTAREVANKMTSRGRRSSSVGDEDTHLLLGVDTTLRRLRDEPNVISVTSGVRNVCLPIVHAVIQFLQGELESRWVLSVEWTGDDLARRLQWRTVMDGQRHLIGQLHLHHSVWLQGLMRGLMQHSTILQGELEAALQTLKSNPSSQTLMETCRAKAALCREHTVNIRQKAYITNNENLRVVFCRFVVQLTAFISFFSSMRLLTGAKIPDVYGPHAAVLMSLQSCSSIVFSAASFTLDHVPVISVSEIERLCDIAATVIIRKFEDHLQQLTYDGALTFADHCVAYTLESILRFDMHQDLPLPDQIVAAVEGLQLVVVDRNRSKVGSRKLSYDTVSAGIAELLALSSPDSSRLPTKAPTAVPWTFQNITRECGIITDTGKYYACNGRTDFGFRFDTVKHAVELGMVPSQMVSPEPRDTIQLWIDDAELVQMTPSYFSFSSPILASLLHATPVLTAGVFVHQMRWDRPAALMHKFVSKYVWRPGGKCDQCHRNVNPLTTVMICTECECVVHTTCSLTARKNACGMSSSPGGGPH